MAVTITSQDLIAALDPDWAQKGRDNTTRANTNDTNLKTAVEALQAAPQAVRTVNLSGTDYTPDGTGKVTLPGGVTASAVTTAQRDAIVSPGVGLLVYNTTNARLEVRGASGWSGVGNVQIDVFTASGTWTKPSGAKLVFAVCIGAGGAGSGVITGPGSTLRSPGGGAGARVAHTFAAALLAATVSVTVGAGGTAPAAIPSGPQVTNGAAGGHSVFGPLKAGGGDGAIGSSTTPAPGGVPGAAATVLTGGFMNGLNGFNGSAQWGQILTALGLGAWGGTGDSSNELRHGAASLGLGPGGGGGAYYDGSTSYSGQGGSAVGLGTYTDSNGGFVRGGGAVGSRTGTGVGGDGGASAAATGGSTTTGVDGQVPGGGGGGALRFVNSGTAQPGAGARGEVVVVTIF